MMLQLGCGHTMCSACLGAQLQAGWPGPRMTFGYLHCGMCRAPLAHDSALDALQAHGELRNQVLEVATQQYITDGLYMKLCGTLGRRPQLEELDAQVEAKMAVYRCSDCRQPYCAGLVDCLATLDQEGGAQRFQCRECEWYAQPALRAACSDPEHRDCAMFKCNSCCNVAVWHCQSNRYCDRCHDEASAPKHYPCPGPS